MRLNKNSKILAMVGALSFLVLAIVVIMFANGPKGINYSLDEVNLSEGVVSHNLATSIPKTYQLTNFEPKYAGYDMEKSSVDLALKTTNALNDINDTNYKDTEQYFQPLDEKKVKDLNYLLSDEFKDHNNRSTNLWVAWLVWRNDEMNNVNPMETAISYSSPEKVVVKVYLDAVRLGYMMTNGVRTKVDKMGVDIILEYTIFQQNGKYYVYDLKFQPVKNIDNYKQQIVNNEINQDQTGQIIQKNTKFAPDNAFGYDYSKIKSVDDSLVNSIYQQNVTKTVILVPRTKGGMGASVGYGCFIAKGVVLTTWSAASKLVDQNVTDGLVVSSDGKLHHISGVISASTGLDLAILKLDEAIGAPVKLNFAPQVKQNDPVVVIGSPLGITSVARVGLYGTTLTTSTPTMITSLPLDKGDDGSPLFNLNGEVIGVNTMISSDKIYSDSASARPVSFLKDLTNRLAGQDFKQIKSTSFAEIRKGISGAANKSVSLPNDSLANDYKKSPNLTTIDSIKITDARVEKGYLTVRYQTSDDALLPNDMLLKIYQSKLEAAGFKTVFSADKRFTYVKGRQVIRLALRANYLSMVYGEGK